MIHSHDNHMNRSPESCSWAFTLIELLVVIAIISLLVSILLPSLTKAKDLARQVTCMSNMKNLYLPMQYYSEDNDNSIVPTLQYDSLYTGKIWQYCLMDKDEYLTDWSEFACPDRDPITGQTVPIQLWQSVGVNSYFGPTYDRNGAKMYGSEKFTDIQDPADRFFYTDANNYMVQYPDIDMGGYLKVIPIYRHIDAINLCFGDGHVEDRTDLLLPFDLSKINDQIAPW